MESPWSVDLRTTYLGLDLEHPFAVGACPLSATLDGLRTLEDCGASMVTLQSLYAEQLRAESMATYESIYGPAESFGEATSYLPKPEEFAIGPDSYLEGIGRATRALSIPVSASLNGAEPGPWLDYAGLMQEAGAAAIELNVYEVVIDPGQTAQSVEDRSVEIVREVRKRTTLPLAVKLSPFYTALPNFAGRLIDAGATGLVLFNRFFEPDVDAENLEIVPHLTLSTPVELLLRLRWLAVLSGEVGCPLATSGGVHKAHDAVKAVMCGAHAVQMVSALLGFGPALLSDVKREFAAWLDEHEYESVEQLRGSMDIERCPDPGALTRAQYVRSLQTWRPQPFV